MINTPDEEHVPVPGVDTPNYGAEAIAAQKAGQPLTPPGFVEYQQGLAVGPAVANDVQHGGDHYQKRFYQHWDFVCDTNLHYLLACATKYVSRWRDKNGVEDLDKAAHYVQKAMERGVVPDRHDYVDVGRFTSQLEWREAAIVADIMRGDYPAALNGIAVLRSAA